jgi:ADP-dependent phosphofructokinase/glucokinase
LWERVEKEWDTFTKEDCQKYIDSMPKRIEAVIKAKGGYTKY